MFDFAKYLGSWTLDRQISNGCKVAGTAAMVFDNLGCSYIENGRLFTPDGNSFVCTRRYFYVWQADKLDVYFDEPRKRTFLNLETTLEGNIVSATGIHFCGEDTYRAYYRFQNLDLFSIKHEVSGPKKSYVSVTNYTRQN